MTTSGIAAKYTLMRQQFLLLLFFLLTAGTLHAQTGDIETYGRYMGEPDVIAGTSRYVALCGAMAALGGDVAAVADNPAAVAVFRRSEITLSTDIYSQRSRSVDNYSHTAVSVPALAWVFHVGGYGDGAVKGHNFSVSYKRTALRSESWTGSLQPEYARMPIGWYADAYGRTDDYAIDYGFNLRNRLYIGAGMALRTLSVDVKSDLVSDTLVDYFSAHTLGVHLRAGVIYRPAAWLRLGAAIHSPVFMNRLERRPMKVVAGLALQAKEWGLLSVEYDYTHDGTHLLADMHKIKAGAEYVFLRQGFIDAGYAYSFYDARHYASFGLSWRSKWWVVGGAYQCSFSNNPAVRYFFPQPEPDFRSLTHRFVLTVAFRYGADR